MEEPEVIRKAGETFVDSEIAEPFILTKRPKNLFEKILFKYWPAKGRVVYPIRRLLVGNRVRVAARGVNFDTSIFDKGIVHAIMHGSVNNTEDTIYIAAVAIQNNRNEPSAELLEELRWVDDKTLAMLVDRALSQVDIENFMKPIILISGTNIMKMSPTPNEEIIASQTSGL